MLTEYLVVINNRTRERILTAREHPDPMLRRMVEQHNNARLKEWLHYYIYNDADCRANESDLTCTILTDVGPVVFKPVKRVSGKATLDELKKEKLVA